MIAAGQGRLDNVRLLLAAEADVDVRDDQGRTAIDFAGDRKRDDIVEAIESASGR